jgi:hypothetical protein
MKLLRKFGELVEYGLFLAALLPTLLVLLAASVVLAGGDSAAVPTMPTIPIYRPG